MDVFIVFMVFGILADISSAGEAERIRLECAGILTHK